MRTTGRVTPYSVAAHVLFWLAFILYEAISFNWEDTDSLTFRLVPAITAVIIPVTILVTYINLYGLMPAFYYRRLYMRYALALLFVFLAGGFLQRCISYQWVIPWERLNDPARYRLENKNFWIPVRIIRNSIQLTPIVALTTLMQLMRRAYSQEKVLRELQMEKHAAEMGLLKAQVNPHFLFNTLNSLYALTLKGSDRAPGVTLRLSALMHYMLYEASAEKVSLKKEIDYLENYIGIEKIRFADRLELSFQCSGEIGDKVIAPLMLVPFVENAFKHGLENGMGWVTINLNVMGGKLFFKVENSSSFAGAERVSSGGLGLRNVRRRLELTYPDQFTLELTRNEASFEADLKINL